MIIQSHHEVSERHQHRPVFTLVLLTAGYRTPRQSNIEVVSLLSLRCCISAALIQFLRHLFHCDFVRKAHHLTTRHGEDVGSNIPSPRPTNVRHTDRTLLVTTSYVQRHRPRVPEEYTPDSLHDTKSPPASQAMSTHLPKLIPHHHQMQKKRHV